MKKLKRKPEQEQEEQEEQEQEENFTHGFNEVFKLSNTEKYVGSANFVMLVWNKNQIFPAEQYRKANYENIKVDIAICEDPNIQREQIGFDRSLIYHHS